MGQDVSSSPERWKYRSFATNTVGDYAVRNGSEYSFYVFIPIVQPELLRDSAITIFCATSCIYTQSPTPHVTSLFGHGKVTNRVTVFTQLIYSISILVKHERLFFDHDVHFNLGLAARIADLPHRIVPLDL